MKNEELKLSELLKKFCKMCEYLQDLKPHLTSIEVITAVTEMLKNKKVSL